MRAVEDATVASVAASGLVFAGWLSVGIEPVGPMFAQLIGSSVPSGETFFEFAIRQGGAFAVLLIVLFYYRRDYRDLTAFRSERDAQLVAMVKEATQSNAAMADALRENTTVVQRANYLIAEHLPTRRLDDKPR